MTEPQSRVEAEARAEWNNPSIQAEFGKFPTYLAFKQANADGAVKIYGRNKVITGEAAASVRRPTIEQILGPPEVPNPAPTPNAAAVAAFHELDGKIQAGLDAIKTKHGVAVRELNWKPGDVVVRLG